MSVKITIPTYFANLLAPHTCCGCNIVGTLLCDNCKNDIIRDPLYRCLECGQPTLSGQCQTCTLPYTAAWCALQREGTRLSTPWQTCSMPLHRRYQRVPSSYPSQLFRLTNASVGMTTAGCWLKPLPGCVACPASQFSRALSAVCSWGVAVPSASGKLAKHSPAHAHSHQKLPIALLMIFLQQEQRFAMPRVASALLVHGRLLQW